MPAWPLPAAAAWTGRLGELVRIGGDLREQWSRTEVTGQPTQEQWSLDQARLYADVAVIGDRLGIYLDQQLAAGFVARAGGVRALRRRIGPLAL